MVLLDLVSFSLWLASRCALVCSAILGSLQFHSFEERTLFALHPRFFSQPATTALPALGTSTRSDPSWNRRDRWVALWCLCFYGWLFSLHALWAAERKAFPLGRHRHMLTWASETKKNTGLCSIAASTCWPSFLKQLATALIHSNLPKRFPNRNSITTL